MQKIEDRRKKIEDRLLILDICYLASEPEE